MGKFHNLNQIKKNLERFSFRFYEGQYFKTNSRTKILTLFNIQ